MLIEDTPIQEKVNAVHSNTGSGPTFHSRSPTAQPSLHTSEQTVPMQMLDQKGNIIVKEIFCHAAIKLYPNGWVTFDLKGRSKDMILPNRKVKKSSYKKREEVTEL